MNRFWHSITLLITNPKAGFNRLSNLYNVFNVENRRRTLYETFIAQEYKKLYDAIKPDTILLDIGAYIGDTAIYFAMNPNVKRVYSYEPIPKTFEEAKGNISCSSLGYKIFLSNAGIGGNNHQVHIEKEYVGTNVTNLKDAISEKGKAVRVLSLNHILRNKHRVAIKCDCEGSEQYIFDKADLRNVYVIMLEYHGPKDKIYGLLEKKGFEVQYIDAVQSRGMQFRGIIYAER